MIRKICGFNLKENDNFCDDCGELVDINDNSNVSKNENLVIDNNVKMSVSFDEKLIKTYIGPKANKMYDDIKDGGLNMCAILFGINYFVYRKMYLISIVLSGLICIVGYFVPSIVSLISIIISFMFCPIYKWDITKKLRKIKNDNHNANQKQLLELAEKKGGTSIVGVIVFLVIYSLIIVLS